MARGRKMRIVSFLFFFRCDKWEYAKQKCWIILVSNVDVVFKIKVYVWNTMTTGVGRLGQWDNYVLIKKSSGFHFLGQQIQNTPWTLFFIK